MAAPWSAEELALVRAHGAQEQATDNLPPPVDPNSVRNRLWCPVVGRWLSPAEHKRFILNGAQ